MFAPEWFSQLLDRELGQWIRLSEFQTNQLYQHYDLLLRWNQRMNLTTIKPGREMVIRHYCESLFFAAHLPANLPGHRLADRPAHLLADPPAHLSPTHPVTVLDLGSGAGFPGVPLAVLQPQWSVTLVESVQKKAVFLREATRHLSNISVLAQRMEDMGVNVLAKGMEDVGVNALAQGVEDVDARADADARADWVVARAVDPQEVIASVPRLAPNIGLMIGDEDVSRVTAESRIAWQAPVRLPWGDRRLCIFGRCSTWNVEH